MDTDFKVGDCVQLRHGETDQMNIAEIFELTKEAKCIWRDRKTGNNKIQDLPLSVLKHCPKEMTEEEKVRLMQEIIPPRKHI
jgi:protoporphyrinogen oxidase